MIPVFGWPQTIVSAAYSTCPIMSHLEPNCNPKTHPKPRNEQRCHIVRKSLKISVGDPWGYCVRPRRADPPGTPPPSPRPPPHHPATAAVFLDNFHATTPLDDTRDNAIKGRSTAVTAHAVLHSRGDVAPLAAIPSALPTTNRHKSGATATSS